MFCTCSSERLGALLDERARRDTQYSAKRRNVRSSVEKAKIGALGRAFETSRAVSPDSVKVTINFAPTSRAMAQAACAIESGVVWSGSDAAGAKKRLASSVEE